MKLCCPPREVLLLVSLMHEAQYGPTCLHTEGLYRPWDPPWALSAYIHTFAFVRHPQKVLTVSSFGHARQQAREGGEPGVLWG